MIRRHILRGRQRGRVRSGRVRFELERLEERTLLSGLSIAAENQLPGVPASVWDISGAGDPSLQGFATDISVNQGQTVSFKIDDTSGASYHIDVYRMGYYQGNGARLVTTIPSSQTLRQVQPAPLTDPTTSLVDCGNWSVSASWAVPADATSGIYFARLARDDTGGASQVFFVVRDDTDHSQILFKTSDSTWEAYNTYGGNDIENPDHADRAYAASYNRPFDTRATVGGEGDQNFVFNAEYPMVRWLEANGYDVSYFTDVDTNRYGGLIQNHQIFLSVGHDEYWSGDERANVEAAQDVGVNLAFFSGNEIFRKTRWEPSIDGSETAYRTMVIYNESYDNAQIDPLDTAPTWTWTGTWRDTRFSPPSDGGLPENALSGTLYVANNAGNDVGISMEVPANDANLRFWRNTSVATLAPGQVATLGDRVVGYEVDEDLDNGFRPAGLIDMSSTTYESTSMALVPWGTEWGPGTSTHSITLYRAPSGALVFAAGTVQWSWGLDGNHDDGDSIPDVNMQQATVNLLADMGVQPVTLQSGLVPAIQSTDYSPPTSTIISPAAGASFPNGTTVTIAGTAVDAGGGVVGEVEVSVDGGLTWHPAIGRENWTYTWTTNEVGPVTIKSRAVDDSGNLETPSAGVTVSLTGPISIWSASTTPRTASETDDSSIEVGVKFRSDVPATILGVRFYKGADNTGTHVGNLWDANGTLLASATFTNETATGWQQVLFASPVTIAPNTTYVASYLAPEGHYDDDDWYFSGLDSGVNNGPLHALADGLDGGNGVFVYSSSSAFPTDTLQSANYWVDVVYSNSVTDTTPPTVTSETPAAGANGVSTTASITATFSESVQAGTISFVLKDAAGNSVTATSRYDSETFTATLTPSAPLSLATTYTATVSGAQDLADNVMASPVSWSFITATVPDATIWPNSAVPEVPSYTDGIPIEVGVKFLADTAGSITGIRFYKGADNTGTHVGNLWTAGGTLLASATFTGETATGWQQVNFATPVVIAANTTYVASYYSPTGVFADDEEYFASTGVANGHLEALSSPDAGGNGVFVYGVGGGFPLETANAANYWVDVVFDTSVTDTTLPAVASENPGSNVTGVAVATTCEATFSEPVQASTFSFTLKDSSGNVVPATVAYGDSNLTAFLTPNTPLAYSTTYTATISGAMDLAGNAMTAPVSWSFTTADPPDQGPGGPILVIASASNPFGSYYAEILRTEGLNEFSVTDISLVTADTLSSYQVVLLGEMPLTASQVTMFSDWVYNGGDLIAMRPDKQLAGLLGLSDASATLADAYLDINTTAGPGVGITDQVIQFHGSADAYTLNGATSVATLFASATGMTPFPAVTMRSVGPNGGQAVAFTFDLAKSIVYTRQGNPAWAGEERDGQPPIRSDDLFYGDASFDPEPNYVDLSKVAIPQADEQQRLLANIITEMDLDRMPLPRFWYFPDGAKAVVLMTGDDHGNDGTAGRFDTYEANSPSGSSVDDWTAIRSSSFIYPGTPLTDAQAAAYMAAGFEVGCHFSTDVLDWTSYAQLDSIFTEQLAEWRADYPSLPPPSSNRTHAIVWSDYSSMPEVELAHGIQLDLNYYYWPPGWVQDQPGMFTGSGMPMRFATADGTMIDVFQAATQMTDESGQTYPYTIDTLLDNALGSLSYYGVFTANMHTDSATSAGSDAIITSALSRGVPVVSGSQMLTWLDGRDNSSFSGLSWDGATRTMDFTIKVGAGANGLDSMLPSHSANGLLSTITRDGTPIQYTTQTIKGIEYAFFAAGAGSYQASYAPDTTPPSLTVQSPAPGATNVAAPPSSRRPSASRSSPRPSHSCSGTPATNLSRPLLLTTTCCTRPRSRPPTPWHPRPPTR